MWTSRYLLSLVGGIFLVLSPTSLYSDVVDSSSSGFTSKNSVWIAAPPDQVYRHLVDHVGRWWSPDHTFSGKSSNLYIEEKANGCFCETLDGGGSVRHLAVVFTEPGKTLRLAGGLGPLQSMAVTGTLTWSLSRSSDSTKVELTYTVGGYRQGGLQNLASPVDRVLCSQLNRLKNYVERGTPEGDSQKAK